MTVWAAMTPCLDCLGEGRGGRQEAVRTAVLGGRCGHCILYVLRVREYTFLANVNIILCTRGLERIHLWTNVSIVHCTHGLRVRILWHK